MDRKSLVFELLTALLTGLTIGYFIFRGTDRSRLQDEMENLETQLADKEAQVASLHLRVASVEQQLEIRILGVYFSPRRGCEDQVINWIDRANDSIHVLIYRFTLDSIGDALIAAHNRGVDVKVVFEEGQISR